MKRWEYKVVALSNTTPLTEAVLDVLGKDGWELVAMVADCLIFKRELLESLPAVMDISLDHYSDAE